MQKLTVIWQSESPHEREWIDEIFGPYISGHITDAKHRLVMDNSILCDAFIHCFDRSYYGNFKGLNSYLVHFLDENYDGGYERYENFRGVFRCFWSNVFNTNYIRKLPLGYSNGLERDRPIIPASNRTYVWSFAGHVDKSSRPEMAAALARVEPHYLFSSSAIPGFVTPLSTPSHKRVLPPSTYYSLLFDSTFSPCPMGNVNLECFRVYEALECGSIPIVEKRPTMDCYRTILGDHPMPTVTSWSKAKSLIESLLRDPAELNALQDKCLMWWKAYKKDYSTAVGEFLAQRSALPSQVEAPVSRRYHLPFWQSVELLRHHNAGAAIRRARRQAARLLKHRKLRVAHSPATISRQIDS